MTPALRVLSTCILAFLLGCEASPPVQTPAPEADAADDMTAAAPDLAGVEVLQDAGAQAPEAEVRAPIELAMPLQTLPSSKKELEAALLAGDAVGTIAGDIFKESVLLGIVRTECGEGVTLQPVFRQNKKLRVSTPIRLPLYSLATKDPVVIEDGVFRIESHFTADNAERLTGRLAITYTDGKQAGTFIAMTVDAKPLETLLPPNLDGSSKLPSYSRCTPTGFARIDAEGRSFTGLIHADDVGDRGVPSIWLALRPEDTMHLMVIPPEPKTKIEGLETPLELEAAREKSSRPVVLLGKFVHMGRIAPDADATSANLDRPREATLFEGKVTELTLVPEGKRWRLRMTVEGIIIPEMLEGDLGGRRLDTLRIDTLLAPKGAMEPSLPEAPEWWTGAANE